MHEGSLVFSAQREFWVYSPLGSIKTPEGLKMPMIPRAWGVIITFLLG